MRTDQGVHANGIMEQLTIFYSEMTFTAIFYKIFCTRNIKKYFCRKMKKRLKALRAISPKIIVTDNSVAIL